AARGRGRGRARPAGDAACCGVARPAGTPTAARPPAPTAGARRRGAGGPGSPVSPPELLQCLDLELLVGHDPLEPGVLGLQLLEPLDVIGLQPTVLGPPGWARSCGRTGRSRRCTTSGTGPSARTPAASAPPPAPRSWRPCATWRSGCCARPVIPASRLGCAASAATPPVRWPSSDPMSYPCKQ